MLRPSIKALEDDFPLQRALPTAKARILQAISSLRALISRAAPGSSGPLSRPGSPGSLRLLASAVVLTALFASTLSAQALDVRAARITLDDGLSQSSVYAIVQDRLGFMWFGTEEGLNRYDGYSFETYRSDPANPSSLSGSTVYALHEDRSGTLWVGTWRSGLNRYDRSSDSFSAYRHDPGNVTSLSHDTVFTLHEDPGGLWVGTLGGGLSHFDRETEVFTSFRHDPEDADSLSHDHVMALHQSSAGLLWIGTDGGGLNALDPETGRFVRFRNDPEDERSLSHDKVYAIHEDDAGVLWVGTYGAGLNRFEPETGTFSRYRHDPTQTHSLSNDAVTAIHEDRYGALWIGTGVLLTGGVGGGLNRFDRNLQLFVPYTHDPVDPESLSSNDILSLYEDRAGVLWAGTSDAGLNKFVRRPGGFAHLRSSPNNPHGLSESMIFAVHEDRAGTLWMGTFGGGLNRLDPGTGTFTHYRHDPRNAQSLSSDEVMSIEHDRFGNLWVGTDGDGLNRLDRATGAFRRYRHDPADPEGLGSDAIYALHEDREGVLWMGTFDAGLDRYDRDTDSFTHFRHDPSNPRSLSDDKVYCIHGSRTGALWICTEGGLNHFEPNSGNTIRYLHDPVDPTSLSSNDVLTAYEDEAGILWVGTYGGGLNRFDPASESFTAYTEKDGLPNNVIYGILADDDGFLWMSTNKGLSRFDPRAGTLEHPGHYFPGQAASAFRNYDVSDGLQSNEFNSGAFTRGADGRLYFGGVNGVTAFDPDRLQDNPHVPPIALTSFKKFNEEFDLGVALEEVDEITLAHDDAVVSLEFAALDYTTPAKNRYAYRLEGFSDEWIRLETKRDVTFTNLDPRTYTLQVVGSNNDGVWNEEGRKVRLVVMPPWWMTWWFRIGSLLGLGLLLSGAHRLRTRTMLARNRALEAEILERKRIEEHLEAFFSQSLDGCFFMMLDEPVAWHEGIDRESVLDYVLAHERITKINQAMIDQYGGTPGDFLGLTPADLFRHDTVYGRSRWAELLDQGRVKLETDERKLDGTPMWVEGEYVCLYDEENRVKGHFGIQRDITDRKRSESEREALISDLERRNAEMERFTYTVSHDLKSPLVTIKGFLGLLRRDVARGDAARVEADIEKIGSAADRMHRLLGELLELSRVGRQINPPEAVRLDELACEASEILAGAIGDRGVSVEMASEMPTVHGDRLRLLEVYQNLVENAVRFLGGQEHPRIEIGAKAEEREALCWIRDNGIGIDPAYHERVFGLFERLDADQDGTGIGLALVKRIVELHGGRVWIESEGKGRGATFWFTLPLETGSG